MAKAESLATQTSGDTALDGLAVDALIRLRWMAVLGQFTTVLLVWSAYGIMIPWGPVLFFIGLTALSNVLLAALRSAGWRLGVGAVPHVMVWDTLFLAGLLYWTGGAMNPFCLFLLLNAVLAALTLGRFAAWLLLLLGVGSLFLLTDHAHPLLIRNGGPLPQDLWLKGHVVAFFLNSSTLIYLVQRLRGQLREEMKQRRVTMERLAEERRFHALATLAAGAAHEMGTPLSTIAVVSREMEIELGRDDPEDELSQMAKTIRAEVERCRQILARLRPDEASQPGEKMVLSELEALVRESVPQAERGRLRFLWAGEQEFILPKETLREVLGNLVRNALQASAHDQVVEVSADVAKDTVRFVVRDRGPGIPDELRHRLGEPFVTTKAPGEGMGLGLHLVRLLAHQMGGSLQTGRRAGGGEEMVFSLPQKR